MPNKDELKHIIGKSAIDLKQIRIPGVEKNFEEMTIGELVQVGLDHNKAADCYEFNAVGDNVSVSNSCILHDLGKVASESVIKQEMIKNVIRLKPR